jgi:hypothetical protein
MMVFLPLIVRACCLLLLFAHVVVVVVVAVGGGDAAAVVLVVLCVFLYVPRRVCAQLLCWTCFEPDPQLQWQLFV